MGPVSHHHCCPTPFVDTLPIPFGLWHPCWHLPLLWSAQMPLTPLDSDIPWSPLSYTDDLLTLLRLWHFVLGCPSHAPMDDVLTQLWLWYSAPLPSLPHSGSKITRWAGPPTLLLLWMPYSLHLGSNQPSWTVPLRPQLHPTHPRHGHASLTHLGKTPTPHSGPLKIPPPSRPLDWIVQEGIGRRRGRRKCTEVLVYFKNQLIYSQDQ